MKAAEAVAVKAVEGGSEGSAVKAVMQHHHNLRANLMRLAVMQLFASFASQNASVGSKCA